MYDLFKLLREGYTRINIRLWLCALTLIIPQLVIGLYFWYETHPFFGRDESEVLLFRVGLSEYIRLNYFMWVSVSLFFLSVTLTLFAVWASLVNVGKFCTRLQHVADLIPGRTLRKRVKKMLVDEEAHAIELVKQGRMLGAQWIAFCSFCCMMVIVFRAPVDVLVGFLKRSETES